MTAGVLAADGLVTDPVTLAYHELRSPLGLMVAAARSAADECTDDELRSRCLSILRTAERMLRTTGQMLAVAQVAQEAMPGTFSPVAVVEKLAAEYSDLGVPVVANFPARAVLTVQGDPAQLEALLCTIIGNALDHGAESSAVMVCVAETGDEVTIQVQNAIGITRRHRGLGLSSYIGNKLAESLNATLRMGRTELGFVARISLPATPTRRSTNSPQ